MSNCFICDDKVTNNRHDKDYRNWYYRSDVYLVKDLCLNCYNKYSISQLDKIFKEKIVDNIVKPSHYTWLPGVECLDVAKHFNFCLGNVIKYVWRAGKKESSTALEDLKKAREYLNKEIGRLEND